MSIAFGLLRSVVEDEISFSRLSEEGITSEHFLPGDEIIAYEFMQQYARDIGGTPTLQTIALQINNRSSLENMVIEPFDFWVPRLKTRLRTAIMLRGLTEAQTQIDSGRVDEAISGLGDLYLNLRESLGSGVVGIVPLMRQALEHHNQIQRHEISLGISYGFPYLDDVSGGMGNGDLIVIVGETGVGKTALSLAFGRSAYLNEKSVLYLSTEVGLLSLGKRILALNYQQNSSNLRLGRLSVFTSTYLDNLLRAEESQERPNFFEFMPGGIYASIGDIMLVAKEKSPDLLIIDGAYLLRLSSSKWKITARWDALTNIIHELKNFALLEDIPIVVTFQFNKKDSGSLEGIAGTAEVRRAASIVLSLEFERQEDALAPAEARYRVLKFLKGREGEGGSVRLLFDFIETAILQDRVLSGGVLQQILGTESQIPEDPDDELFTEI